jgi:hypothetical protein
MAIATLLPTWFAPSALSGWCSDHPTLPFGFEIGKINKYAGLNFANLTTKVPMRIVVGAGKMDWLINHS